MKDNDGSITEIASLIKNRYKDQSGTVANETIKQKTKNCLL